MNTVEFNDFKNKKKVQVPVSEVKKVTYERVTKNGTTQIRYALKAVKDGVKLNKFVSKATWDSIA